MDNDVRNNKNQPGEKIIMAKKKTVIERKPIKIKRSSKISDEQREVLRERMTEMRKKRKPAEYKNISKSCINLYKKRYHHSVGENKLLQFITISSSLDFSERNRFIMLTKSASLL